MIKKKKLQLKTVLPFYVCILQIVCKNCNETTPLNSREINSSAPSNYLVYSEELLA